MFWDTSNDAVCFHFSARFRTIDRHPSYFFMNPDSLPCLPEGALSGEETLCNNSFRRDSGVIRSVYREMDSFSELPDYVSTDIAVYDVVSDGITYFATVSQNRCSMFCIMCCITEQLHHQQGEPNRAAAGVHRRQ